MRAQYRRAALEPHHVHPLQRLTCPRRLPRQPGAHVRRDLCSFLSEVIRAVEEKLEVRLLNRTSRSVSMTETGERLFAQIKPLLERFAAVAESINEAREKPAGRVRLSVPRAAANLYCPGHRRIPAALQTLIDFLRSSRAAAQ